MQLKVIGSVLLLSGLVVPAMADERRQEWLSAEGDTLTIQHLPSGELWASFTMTDQRSVGFADNEQILLQVDQHKPIKLKQAFRSCAAPAAPKQTVSFDFDKQLLAQPQWAFSGVGKPRHMPLKLLGWDAEDFDSIKADRREVVVDFPLTRSPAGAAIQTQLKQGQRLVFHYVTDDGEVRQAIFDLQQQRGIATPHTE